MAPGALHPPLNTRRRHCVCVHAFAAGKSPGNPHKTDLTQQRNGSSFEKPKRDVRGLYCTALCLCGARGRATHPRPAPRCLPCPSSSAPCRAALSVASPFALLLPLRLVKKKAAPRLHLDSRPRQPAYPDNQTNPPGAAKHRCSSAPSRAPRLPPRPHPPRSPPAEARLPSAATTCDLPSPVPESKILSPVPCFGSSGTLNFAGSAGLTATSLLLRAQISVGRHGVTRSVLSS